METLVGDEIPRSLRRPGLDMIFAVTDTDGSTYYLESDIEALQLLIELDEKERKALED
ncbi:MULTISPECIES: hypothetical protein [Pseudomonas syringae group]|nr:MULTISPECIES: hypothetical protein [Pseudomonas syringae group]MBD1108146.1 hypothetical protein [Pseudomonas amygdali pv. morsprunorum]MBI6732634.1 hypothetical protein [Pseudomonas amygdali]MBI6812913.1 hypothetical protein [Pseudomonas amygdali]MDT3224969.1 hypothetical protein [Pseudomonas amygdali pv. morsprunorum]MDT3243045.1 hypothetical protein [Pseudomonas amygdali pv. morsprunorum]